VDTPLLWAVFSLSAVSLVYNTYLTNFRLLISQTLYIDFVWKPINLLMFRKPGLLHNTNILEDYKISLGLSFFFMSVWGNIIWHIATFVVTLVANEGGNV
jgi:hypothetical protein